MSHVLEQLKPWSFSVLFTETVPKAGKQKIH